MSAWGSDSHSDQDPTAYAGARPRLTCTHSLLVGHPDLGRRLEHGGRDTDKAGSAAELEHLLAAEALGLIRMPAGEVLRQDLGSVTNPPEQQDLSPLDSFSHLKRRKVDRTRYARPVRLTSPEGHAMPPHPGPASTLSRTPAVPGTGISDSAFSVVVGGRGGAIPSKRGSESADPVDRTERRELIDAERERMISPINFVS